MDRRPDTRDRDRRVSATRFLAWGGLALDLWQRGARRQLDYERRAGGPEVLTNRNRLAETTQTTRPVHDTLDPFLDHGRRDGWERVCAQLVQRLRRLKALDAARLLGRPVLWIDATGLIGVPRRQGPHCLVQRQGPHTL